MPSISAGAIEGHFEGKMPQEGHQGGPCSCTMPRLTGYSQPRRNWPTWASNILVTHPISLFPGLKKQLKVHHFLSNTEVIAAAGTWLDGQPSEFFSSGLQKSEQRTKCIELRGEYVE